MLITRLSNHLAWRGYQLHRDQLQQDFGNILSPAHDHAVKSLHTLIAAMLDGQDTKFHGSWGFGASVGVGKSTGLCMAIKAAASMNLLGIPGHDWEHTRNVSAIITAMRIESLYELERLMMLPTGHDQFSVPAHRIAVVHADTTGKYRKSDDSKTDAPIVLIAHNKLKHVSKCPTAEQEEFLSYRGRVRDICLIDEAFNDSEATYLDQGLLVNALRSLVANAKDHRDSKDFKALIEVMEPLFLDIKRENDRQHQLEYLPRTEGLMQTPSLSMGETADLKALVCRIQMSKDDRRLLLKFVDMLPSTLRLIRGKQAGVVSVVNTMPPCLTNRLELNASFEIDRLSVLDPTVKNADTQFPMLNDLRTVYGLKGLADIIDYSDLTITHLNRGGGKSTMEGHLKDIRKMTPSTQEVMDFYTNAIKATPADEGILVVTFKDDGPEYVKTLQKVFIKSGIDLAVTVKDTEGNDQPRVSFTTYGEHLSTNRWRYCSTLICAGVMQRHRAQVAGAMCGRREGSIMAKVDFPEVEQVFQAIAAADTLQTIGRLRLRIIKNGKALPARVFVAHMDSPEHDYRDRLMKGYPSATCLDQLSETRKKASKTYQVSLVIGQYLKTNYQGIAVPTANMAETLREHYRPSHVSSDVFLDAIRLFLKDNPEWKRSGHALIKVSDYLFPEVV